MAGPDGLAYWGWPVDRDEVGSEAYWDETTPVTVTVSCTLNGATAQATGQAAIKLNS